MKYRFRFKCSNRELITVDADCYEDAYYEASKFANDNGWVIVYKISQRQLKQEPQT